MMKYMLNRQVVFLLAAAASALAGPTSARGQSASAVLNAYLEAHTERLGGVEDVHLVQSVMGRSNEMYMEKVESNGLAMLEPRVMVVMGRPMAAGSDASEGALADPSSYLVAIADRAEITGTETIDGEETTVVYVDDLSGIDLQPPAAGGQPQEIQARSLTLYMDEDDQVIRRLEMVADVTTPQGTSETDISLDFTDFRDVGGLVYPFLTSMSMTGLDAAISPEEMAEARRALEEMRTQLATMPESQRAMVERMMGGQMEELMEMVESGSLNFEVVVEDLSINGGIPEV